MRLDWGKKERERESLIPRIYPATKCISLAIKNLNSNFSKKKKNLNSKKQKCWE